MTQSPAYKGSIVSGLVSEVNKCLETGEVTRDDAERVLTPDDFELLDSTIVPSRLYPLAAFARMSELLYETVGGGNLDFLVDMGRRSAIRLVDDERIYAQLNYVRRTEVVDHQEPVARFEAFGRDLKIIGSLFESVSNFGKCHVIPDPEHELRWTIDDELPLEFNDLLVWRLYGFYNELARRHQAPDLWYWHRVAPTLVRFRMTRDA